MRFREWLARFMYGRYGTDQLYYALLVLYLILFVLGRFLWFLPFSLLTWVVMIYAVFRVFSRNIARRRAENDRFLKIWNPIRSFFSLQWRRIKECRTAVYRKCPDCGAMLRLPHRRGKHTAACPRCGRRFDVRILF